MTDEPPTAQGADLAAPVIGECHVLKEAGIGDVLLEGKNFRLNYVKGALEPPMELCQKKIPIETKINVKYKLQPIIVEQSAFFNVRQVLAVDCHSP